MTRSLDLHELAASTPIDACPAPPPASPAPAAPESSAEGTPFAAEEASRRRFLQASLLGVGALGAISAPSLAHAQTSALKRTFSHYHVAANDKTVHWGYFSKSLKPLVEIEPGDFVTLETVTHHANDDRERMVEGDPGVESIFYWDRGHHVLSRGGSRRALLRGGSACVPG